MEIDDIIQRYAELKEGDDDKELVGRYRYNFIIFPGTDLQFEQRIGYMPIVAELDGHDYGVMVTINEYNSRDFRPDIRTLLKNQVVGMINVSIGHSTSAQQYRRDSVETRYFGLPVIRGN